MLNFNTDIPSHAPSISFSMNVTLGGRDGSCPVLTILPLQDANSVDPDPNVTNDEDQREVELFQPWINLSEQYQMFKRHEITNETEVRGGDSPTVSCHRF